MRQKDCTPMRSCFELSFGEVSKLRSPFCLDSSEAISNQTLTDIKLNAENADGVDSAIGDSKQTSVEQARSELHPIAPFF